MMMVYRVLQQPLAFRSILVILLSHYYISSVVYANHLQQQHHHHHHQNDDKNDHLQHNHNHNKGAQYKTKMIGTSNTGQHHQQQNDSKDDTTMIKTIVGGYAPIDSIRDNEYVQELGQAVLYTLLYSWGISVVSTNDVDSNDSNDMKTKLLTSSLTNSVPIPNYTFQSKMKEYSSIQSMDKNNINAATDSSRMIMATVVDGYQQVVAGMNYRFTVLFYTNTSSATTTTTISTSHDNNHNHKILYMGGISDMIIYDQFGTTLSITQWGTEMTISVPEMNELLYPKVADNNGENDEHQVEQDVDNTISDDVNNIHEDDVVP